MGKVTQLFETEQFRSGLIAGLIAVAMVLIIASVSRRHHRPAIAGLAVAIAALSALQGFGPLPAAFRLDDDILAAVLALAIGGGIHQIATAQRTLPIAVLAALLAPGGVLLARALWDHTLHWAAVVAGIGVPILATFASDCDHFHRRRAFGPAMLAITVCGVYATVPDTEAARALVGSTVVLFVLVLPRPAATLGSAGTAAFLGILFATATIEGAPRPGSIVGAFGCVGLLAVDPIARRVLPELRARDGHHPEGHLRNTLLIVALQGATVAWASRVAGASTGALQAAGILAVGVVASMWAAVWLPKPPLPNRGIRR